MTKNEWIFLIGVALLVGILIGQISKCPECPECPVVDLQPGVF